MNNDHKNKSLELIERNIDGVDYTEEWRPVVEYPDLYHISSFGRLKRLAYKSRQNGNVDKIIPEKIISGNLTKKGYVRLILRNNGLWVSRYCHRLVAFAFIENTENKPDVNHKTGIKLYNHYTQLEWCTPQENNDHGVKLGLLKRGRKPYVNTYVKRGRCTGKKVINIETGEIYTNVDELCRIKSLSIKNIRRQISGERYCYVPYRYLGEEHIVKLPPTKPPKPVKIPFVRPPKKQYIPHPAVYRKMIMCDTDGNELRVFDSSGEAAKFVESNPKTFRKAIKTSPNNFTKGFIWKYGN